MFLFLGLIGRSCRKSQKYVVALSISSRSRGLGIFGNTYSEDLMYSKCHVDANAMVTSWIPRTLLLNYEKKPKSVYINNVGYLVEHFCTLEVASSVFSCESMLASSCRLVIVKLYEAKLKKDICIAI